MSGRNVNESYSRCFAELKARYGDRGVGVNVQKVETEQKKKEEQTRTTSNYYVYDTRSGIASNYRSGEYNGSKYMTSEDFVRYFKSRRPYQSHLGDDKTESLAVSGSLVTRKGAREGSSDSKEGHLSRAISALKALREKWLPIEAKEGRTQSRGMRLPIATMSYIVTVSVALGLLVSGSVMIGRASGELGELNTKIAVLEAHETDLQSRLDLKYDIESVRADAESLGMISGAFTGGKTLSSDSKEEIEIYDNDDKNVGFAALLSSFGIGRD